VRLLLLRLICQLSELIYAAKCNGMAALACFARAGLPWARVGGRAARGGGRCAGLPRPNPNLHPTAPQLTKAFDISFEPRRFPYVVVKDRCAAAAEVGGRERTSHGVAF
jgi:hypothetical protein